MNLYAFIYIYISENLIAIFLMSYYPGIILID